MAINCGAGHICGSDLVLLWLWHRAVAIAPDSTPSLGTSICHKSGPKKKKKESLPLILSQRGMGGVILATPATCGSSRAIAVTPAAAIMTKDP